MKRDYKKELENGAVITEDNLAEYYEFMSDEDIEKNFKIKDCILRERSLLLFKDLFGSVHFNINKFKDYFKTDVYDEGLIKLNTNITNYCTFLDFYYFGVKDTLKPLDEFMAEIKASKEYRRYLSTLDTFENWIKKSLFGKSFGMQLNSSLVVKDGFIEYTPTSATHYGGTVKSVFRKLAIPKRLLKSDDYKKYYAKNYVKGKVSNCCYSKVHVSGIDRYICGICLEEIYVSQVNEPAIVNAIEDLA